MSIAEVDVLRWLHIIAMAYWLGGEWGIFQTSYNVVNRKLSLEERQRHMATIYRIDFMARSGLILLLPLGLHMGHLYGFVPALEGSILVLVWGVSLARLGLALVTVLARAKPYGGLLLRIDDYTRYFVILALLLTGFCAFFGQGPITIETGQNWYPSKMIAYAIALSFGVLLRLVMKEWGILFAVLGKGADQAAEDQLETSIRRGRILAFCYWTSIAGTAFLGAVKPF